MSARASNGTWWEQGPRLEPAIWLEAHDGPPVMRTDQSFHRQPLLDASGSEVLLAGQVRLLLPSPRTSWPPAERASWNIWVEVHAPPLPKVVSIYGIQVARSA